MLKFDPAKRLTAREIQGHPWISGDAKVSSIKPNVLDLMRSYNAERRLKKILITVLASIRFMSVLIKDRPRQVLGSSTFVSFLSLEDSGNTSNSSLTKGPSSQKGSLLLKKTESGTKTPTPSEKSKVSTRRESKIKTTEEESKIYRHKSIKENQLSSNLNRKSIDKIAEKLENKSKSNRPKRSSKDLNEARTPPLPKLGIPHLPTSSATISTVKSPSNRTRNAPGKSNDLGPKIGELK